MAIKGLFQSDIPFTSIENAEEYLFSKKFIDLLIAEYGLDIPFLFEVIVNGTKEIYFIEWNKNGIQMDWKYYSGLVPITPKVISEERNALKRLGLMMDYGIANYLGDYKTLHTDPYGKLIEATIDSVVQKFVEVIDGTPEHDEALAKDLASKGHLTKDGRRIYYIPVPSDIERARQGVAWSWDVPEEKLNPNGFEFES